MCSIRLMVIVTKPVSFDEIITCTSLFAAGPCPMHVQDVRPYRASHSWGPQKLRFRLYRIGCQSCVSSLALQNPSSMYRPVSPSKRLHLANQASRCRVTGSLSTQWRLPRVEYVPFLIYRNAMYMLLSFYLSRLVGPILEFGTRP